MSLSSLKKICYLKSSGRSNINQSQKLARTLRVASEHISLTCIWYLIWVGPSIFKIKLSSLSIIRRQSKSSFRLRDSKHIPKKTLSSKNAADYCW
jgi:hypothetical protein